MSTQFSRIGSDVLAAGAAWTTAKNHIDLIPNGFAGQRKATFNYLTPFDASTAQTSLPSSLPQNLGSTASGDAATPIYLATAGIQIVQDSLNTLGVTANTIVGVIGGGTFSTALDTAKTTIDNVTGMI